MRLHMRPKPFFISICNSLHRGHIALHDVEVEAQRRGSACRQELAGRFSNQWRIPGVFSHRSLAGLSPTDTSVEDLVKGDLFGGRGFFRPCSGQRPSGLMTIKTIINAPNASKR